MMDKELELLVKKMLKAWLSQQLENVKTDESAKGQSFVFLDDRTIQLLMFLFMKKDSQRMVSNSAPSSADDSEWEEAMEENEKGLKEILDLLS